MLLFALYHAERGSQRKSAAKAGIDVRHAQTCLTRLQAKGYVRSINVKLGQRGRRCEYEPVGVECILADVWR